MRIIELNIVENFQCFVISYFSFITTYCYRYFDLRNSHMTWFRNSDLLKKILSRSKLTLLQEANNLLRNRMSRGRERRLWFEWNCGKEGRAQNVQRLQIIVPLLFHTRSNNKEFTTKSARYEISSRAKSQGRGLICARGLLTFRDWVESMMWRAISNYFPNNL